MPIRMPCSSGPAPARCRGWPQTTAVPAGESTRVRESSTGVVRWTTAAAGPGPVLTAPAGGCSRGCGMSGCDHDTAPETWHQLERRLRPGGRRGPGGLCRRPAAQPGRRPVGQHRPARHVREPGRRVADRRAAEREPGGGPTGGRVRGRRGRRLDGVRWYVQEAGRQLDGRHPLDGPVSNIASWNYPMSVLAHAELVQLLAGNAVITKSPTQGGVSTLTLAHALMRREGLPVSLLSGPGGRLAEALVRDPLLGALAFVGGRREGGKGGGPAGRPRTG